MFEEFITLCLSKGLKITHSRRMVLLFLYEAKEPLTAYVLLEKYRNSYGNGEAMTIYRALEYLEKKHLIHKIHSQNKYSLCDFSHKHTDHTHAQFFLCTQCRQIKEIHSDNLEDMLDNLAKTNHFSIQHSALELLGICQSCQDLPS